MFLVVQAFMESTPVRISRSISKSRPSIRKVLHMVLDPQMEDRLDGIRRSYKALTERLGDPDVIKDPSMLKKIMEDRSQSESVVEAYDEHCRLKEELIDAKDLFMSDDTDLKEMAREEMKEIERRLDELEIDIKKMLLPKDKNDDRNVLLEIRAGTGGSEASIFCGDLLDVYRKFITAQPGWTCQVVDASSGESGGYDKVVLDIKGSSVYSKLKREAGVHRVQGCLKLSLREEFTLVLLRFASCLNAQKSMCRSTLRILRCPP